MFRNYVNFERLLTAAIPGMLHENVPITDFLELSVNSPSVAARWWPQCFYHVLTEKCPKRNEFGNSVFPTPSSADLECEESSFAQEIHMTKLGYSFFFMIFTVFDWILDTSVIGYC